VKYYGKLTILLGLIWGFIAIQRIVIVIIMTAIQADMKFTYTDVGMIISITGLIWAFGTIIWASIGDQCGRWSVLLSAASVSFSSSGVCSVVLSSRFVWALSLRRACRPSSRERPLVCLRQSARLLAQPSCRRLPAPLPTCSAFTHPCGWRPYPGY
jgi:hypothetical protein